MLTGSQMFVECCGAWKRNGQCRFALNKSAWTGAIGCCIKVLLLKLIRMKSTSKFVVGETGNGALKVVVARRFRLFSLNSLGNFWNFCCFSNRSNFLQTFSTFSTVFCCFFGCISMFAHCHDLYFGRFEFLFSSAVAAKKLFVHQTEDFRSNSIANVSHCRLLLSIAFRALDSRMLNGFSRRIEVTFLTLFSVGSRQFSSTPRRKSTASFLFFRFISDEMFFCVCFAIRKEILHYIFSTIFVITWSYLFHE